MTKRILKLSVRIPNFMSDAREWRRAIHAAIVKVQDQGNVQYSDTDKLEVEIRFHLRDRKLTILDLDNRLKDVLDALQGMIGEKGKSGELRPIIPNDNQIYRLIAEKSWLPRWTEIRSHYRDSRISPPSGNSSGTARISQAH